MNKKKKRPAENQKPEPSKGLSLGDLLNEDLANQLKSLKKEKELELQKQQEEELARKQFEAKQKEKNKSFEELFNESKMDWKKYK